MFEFESGVTRAQLEALFMLLFSQQKDLVIFDTDRSSVSPGVLVGTIQKLDEVVFQAGLSGFILSKH